MSEIERKCGEVRKNVIRLTFRRLFTRAICSVNETKNIQYKDIHKIYSNSNCIHIIIERCNSLLALPEQT